MQALARHPGRTFQLPKADSLATFEIVDGIEDCYSSTKQKRNLQLARFVFVSCPAFSVAWESLIPFTDHETRQLEYSPTAATTIIEYQMFETSPPCISRLHVVSCRYLSSFHLTNP